MDFRMQDGDCEADWAYSLESGELNLNLSLTLYYQFGLKEINLSETQVPY